MIKPKKKKLGGEEILLAEEVMGYNQAIDDYEKFLPSEEEIASIVHLYHYGSVFNGIDDVERDIAKAISKRIRGE